MGDMMGSRKDWSLEEVITLSRNYPSQGVKRTCELLGRPKGSVCNKARQLGVKVRKGHMSRYGWTDDEIKILIQNYNTAEKSNLFSMLPNKTWRAIIHKGVEFNLFRPGKEPPLQRLPPLKLSPVERAQLAMMIDCEGTIALNRINTRLIVWIGVSNTDARLIEEFNRLTRHNGAKAHGVNNGPNRKPIYQKAIRDPAHIYALLKQFKSFLIIKSRQAELILEFIEIKDTLRRNRIYTPTGRQYAIYEEMKTLNRRGV